MSFLIAFGKFSLLLGGTAQIVGGGGAMGWGGGGGLRALVCHLPDELETLSADP